MFILYMMLSLIPVHKSGRLIVQVKKGEKTQFIKFVAPLDAESVKPLFVATPRSNIKLMKELGMDRFYIVDFRDKKEKSLKHMKDVLNSSGIVETCEYDYAKIPMYVPNDEYFSRQWHLTKIDVTHAWDLARGSKSVRIVIDDTGVDWHHNDLLPNMWQNLGEDADHDGHVVELVGGVWQFDPGDVNGVDDDGDGLVDDFVGWNFYNNNNDPEPSRSNSENTHGTHCAGIASAATDNTVGIASTAFSCAIVGSRSYWISNSSSALQWAGDMGFDVFSMSWGDSVNLSYLQSAIQYADSLGVLLIAAAGNDASSDSTVNWPAAYSEVMAVAATNNYDQHTYYTNYGTWVDIAAPGGDYQVDPMIYSTIWDSAYDYMQGTSMATPLVSSLAGLVKSVDTTLTNDSVRSIIEATADSINDTYYLAGELGAGRINAYRAVREVARNKMSYLDIDNYQISDGNNNRPEPGEICNILLTLVDSAGWQSANGVSVTISTNDTSIQIKDSTASYGTIMSGASSTNIGDALSFQVSDSIIPHFVSVVVSYTATPSTVFNEDTIQFLVGQPYILIVDDSHSSGTLLGYYTDDLDSIGFVYDIWNTETDGVPSLSGIMGLTTHRAVFWFTGQDTLPISNEAKDSITAAMDAGTDFLITSQNLSDKWSGDAFYSTYLHASFVNGNANQTFVAGTPGDYVGDSLSLAILGAGGANNSNSEDQIDALSGADICFSYGSDGSAGGAGIKYNSGTYKVVYLGFPLEAVNDQVTGKNTRADVMARVLSWFGIPLTSVRESNNASGAYKLYQKDVMLSGNMLSLTLPSCSTGMFRLYNIQGQLIREGKINNRHLDIDLSNTGKGIYFAFIKQRNSKFRVRLIKTK